jgi:hypothetical protein
VITQDRRSTTLDGSSVVEVGRPKRPPRRGEAKSDALDAGGLLPDSCSSSLSATTDPRSKSFAHSTQSP